MSTPALTRRTLLAGGAVLATTTVLPRLARAAGRIVSPVYPGPWEEAYRAVVLPAVKKTQDVDTVLTPLLALFAICRHGEQRRKLGEERPFPERPVWSVIHITPLRTGMW